jgi:hypothetical protein
VSEILEEKEKMVDYSKWDKLEVSDDEDDDINSMQPRVTKLNGERVQIDKTGASVLPVLNTQVKNVLENQTNIFNQDDDISYLWLNGSSYQNYNWDQSKTEVILRIEIPQNSVAKFIKVLIQDRFVQVLDANNFEFRKKLQYEVNLSDSLDSQSNEYSDWEIITIQNYRFLVITLQKKCPFADAVFWWDRVFKDEPPIDVTNIELRKSKKNKITDNLTDQTESQTSQESVWEQAHKMFLEKMKTKSDPISINI